MSITKTFLLASAFALLASAAPSKTLPRQACTTIYPSIMQTLVESTPDSSYPFGDFRVSTSAGQTDRIYQVIQFLDIPAGTYGCSLNFDFSSSVASTPNAAVDVRTLAVGDSAALETGIDYTWNDLFGPNADGLVGQGLFGTDGPFYSGSKGVVNSESCPTDLNGGGNLGFVFSIADWIQTSETLEFWDSAFYLTFGC